MAETEKRPMRLCDSCGLVDDHPRHVFATDDGQSATDPAVAAKAIRAAKAEDADGILAQVLDTNTITKHMDCCRTDGCPDGTCNIVTAGAEDKRGPALVKHLTARKPEPDTREGGVVEGARNSDSPPTESTFAESVATSEGK